MHNALTCSCRNHNLSIKLSEKVACQIDTLTHWGRDKMAAISQTIFSNVFSQMNIYEFRLIFHWSLFLSVKLITLKHWLTYWLGADQATSHYINQSMLYLGYCCLWVNDTRAIFDIQLCLWVFRVTVMAALISYHFAYIWNNIGDNGSWCKMVHGGKMKHRVFGKKHAIYFHVHLISVISQFSVLHGNQTCNRPLFEHLEISSFC